jgi:O-antigen/teichoic acid export membrane protein
MSHVGSLGMGKSLRRLVVPTLALAASGSTTLGFNVVLARALSTDEYGNLARAFAVSMAVAQLSMASIAPALSRVVASAPDDERRFDRAPSAIRVIALVSLAVSLLYIPLALAGFVPSGTSLVLGGFAAAWVYATYFGIKMILFALNRISVYALLELASDVVFFATLIVLALTASRASLFAFVAAYGLFTIVSWRYIRARARTPERVAVDREVARYSGLALVATYASVVRFPFAIAITGLLGSSTDAARIALILGLAMPLFLVPQAAGVITFAGVARDQAGDIGHVREMVRAVGFLSSLAAVAVALLAGPILALVGGSDYRAGASAFALIVLCLVPQVAGIPIGNAAAARGDVRATAFISVSSLLITVLGAAVAVPAYGLTGAAVAVGAGMAFGGCLLLGYGFRNFGLTLSDVGGFLIVLAAGVVAVTISAGLAVAVLIAVLGATAALAMSWSKLRVKQATS